MNGEISIKQKKKQKMIIKTQAVPHSPAVSNSVDNIGTNFGGFCKKSVNKPQITRIIIEPKTSQNAHSH